MKRDKEWLKKGIEVVLYRANLRGTLPVAEGNLIYDDIVSQIDQLDEPEITLNEAFNKLEETHILSKKEIAKHFEQLEIHNGKVTYGDYETLSQKWIDEHRKSYTMEDSVEISDLQNLIVPKQEELETKIQELIESYKQEEDAYSNPENGWIGGFIEDLKNLVEKEQKYYVLGKNDTPILFRDYRNRITETSNLSDIYPEANSEDFEFTEKEIKDYDERYWAFAKPVEELEE